MVRAAEPCKKHRMPYADADCEECVHWFLQLVVNRWPERRLRDFREALMPNRKDRRGRYT